MIPAIYPIRVHELLRDVYADLASRRGILLRLVAVLLAVFLWDAFAGTQPIYFFPSTGVIFDAFVEQYHEYDLVTAFIGSMQTLLLGYVLAVIIGIPIGIAMGINRYVEVLLDPYVTAMYIAPIAALVPLLIWVFGATFETRVVIVFLFAIFEIIIDTYKGAKATPKEALEVARSFEAGRIWIIRKVIIPNDLPYIFTGLRLGIGRGIKGLVLAEILIQFANLGGIIRLWEHEFRIQGVLSIALLFMILGVIFTKGIQQMEGRLLRWKED